ncbi:MAG: potassium transporter [Draconibacterium sp.]|nr:MAG: potassium transporter [Draconibacterium sp.]PIF05568.1 MAG: potassium transporter [Draconibacterium sp.]
MYNQDFFFQALIYLSAVVISVPIAQKMGFGSVLGYLLAGIIIGPFVLHLVGNEAHQVMHFAEFGVVLMLFVIGLELQPSLLWKMRKSIFGLGGLQVLSTTIIIGLTAFFLGFSLNVAIAMGLILSLSSTAIVIQTLTEKKLLKNVAGRSAFSVLLFQDMAVIPILAILPLLATTVSKADIAASKFSKISWVSTLLGWQQLLLIIGILGGIIFIGGYIARYLFKIAAETGLNEVFTALALFIVIGIAMVMDFIGLSPAFGTFIAGVVFAENEYRHELELTINPFKGLLLGLFFIAVGASINFRLFIEQPWQIIGYVFLLILLKFIVLLTLGKIFKLKKGYEYLFAFLLAQSSEFSFVLISFSLQNQLFDRNTAELILLVATLSMAMSPLLLIFNDRAIRPFISSKENKEEYDEVDELHPVIIAGFGRFGLVLGRFLMANGVDITIIDNNPANVEILRKYGFKLYYGDVTRPDVLEKAGIKNANMLILSMAEYDEALKVAKYVRNSYPTLKILARARDIFHVFEFYKLHVRTVQREMFNSATELGVKALANLGFSKYDSYRSGRIFKHHENQVMEDLYQIWKDDKKAFIEETKRFSRQLTETLLTERHYHIADEDDAWDAGNIQSKIDEN